MTTGSALEADAAGRRIRVARLPRDGERVVFSAGEAERRELASFLSLIALERLSFDLQVAPFGRGGISVRGTLGALVVQESVVTLEPVRQTIDEEVSLTFVPDSSRLPARDIVEDGELQLDPEGDDPPDIFTGETVDLDAALREVLALALDPYPREQDAPPGDRIEDDPANDRVSPFAGLAALQRKGSDG